MSATVTMETRFTRELSCKLSPDETQRSLFVPPAPPPPEATPEAMAALTRALAGDAQVLEIAPKRKRTPKA